MAPAVSTARSRSLEYTASILTSLNRLRQGVDLLFAPGGYLSVPMPLSAAEEVALSLRVAYEVDACHCASSSVSVLWLTMGHE